MARLGVAVSDVRAKTELRAPLPASMRAQPRVPIQSTVRRGMRSVKYTPVYAPVAETMVMAKLRTNCMMCS